MTTPVDPIAVAQLVARALDDLAVPHTIGGSIASSFAGEPRSTVDVDLVGIVRVQGQRLDRNYLRQNAPVLEVDGLLARALAEE